MKYEFFKETLVSKYIRHLLSKTPLSRYSYIYENQYMLSGCYYTYRDKILLCTSSGLFKGIKGGTESVSYLFASDDLKSNDPFNVNNDKEDNLYLSEAEWSAHEEEYYNNKTFNAWMTVNDSVNKRMPLASTDSLVNVDFIPEAQFRIIHSIHFGVKYPNITEVHNVRESLYGPETHRILGEYLRHIKNAYELDLMCLYNCFCGDTTEAITVDETQENTVEESYNVRYKVLLVPIKFDCTYTIALNSDSKVKIFPILYKDGKLLKDKTGQRYLYKNFEEDGAVEYENSLLSVYNTMRFTNPVRYYIRNFKKDIQSYEKYLYLAVQVPKNNESSFVVLEGDYINNSARNISDVSTLFKVGATVNKMSDTMSSNLSLLKKNDGEYHPFADKLIEYLLHNTIDNRELISDNVSRVVNSLGNFHYGYEGQWTNYLRYTLYNRMHEFAETRNISISDLLGCVDSDVESILKKGHLKRDT